VLDRCVDNFFAETEQVAFGTLNIVPGIDFSNDPLLQGRNFSYLDTQLKRLGSPNFTHIPINAPKCPFHHFQQDGHMAMVNPKGRVNYEPNSWNGGSGGPRESFEKGFDSFPAEEAGPKLRIRSETFADHYSQARQFYISQTEIEQDHIAAALTFELSKVETPAIRSRMVSHLLNIDQELAKQVAHGLRLQEMPKPAEAARPTRQDLQKSPALSILLNGPNSFKGRKVGALVTDGVNMALLKALKTALEEEGALLEIVAPRVGGVEASDGSWVDAAQRIDGGPSVLYDAVALLPSEDGAQELEKEAAARDFVADAFAHMKFIGYVQAAIPLFGKAGVEDRDDGCMALSGPASCADFIATCRQLRFWARQEIAQRV
jgi:catalase